MQSHIKRQKTSHPQLYKIVSFQNHLPPPPPPSPPPPAFGVVVEDEDEDHHHNQNKKQPQHHHHEKQMQIAFYCCQSIIVGFLCAGAAGGGGASGNQSWKVGLLTSSKFFYLWVKQYCRAHVNANTLLLAQKAEFSNIHSLALMEKDGEAALNLNTIPSSVRSIILQRLFFLRHFSKIPFVEFLRVEFSSLAFSQAAEGEDRGGATAPSWPRMEGLKTLVLRNIAAGKEYKHEVFFLSLVASALAFPNLTHLDFVLHHEHKNIDLTLLASLDTIHCIHSSKNDNCIKLPTSVRKLYCMTVDHFQGYDSTKLLVLSCYDSEILYTQKWDNLTTLQLSKVNLFGTLLHHKHHQNQQFMLVDAPELVKLTLRHLQTPEFSLDDGARRFPKLAQLSIGSTRYSAKVMNFATFPCSLTSVSLAGMDSVLFEDTIMTIGGGGGEETQKEEACEGARSNNNKCRIETLNLKNVTMTSFSLELLNSKLNLKHLVLNNCRLIQTLPQFLRQLEEGQTLLSGGGGKENKLVVVVSAAGKGQKISPPPLPSTTTHTQKSLFQRMQEQRRQKMFTHIIMPNLESLTIFHNTGVSQEVRSAPMPFSFHHPHPKLTSVTLFGKFGSGGEGRGTGQGRRPFSSSSSFQPPLLLQQQENDKEEKEDEEEDNNNNGDKKEGGYIFLKSLVRNAPNLKNLHLGVSMSSPHEFKKCQDLLCRGIGGGGGQKQQIHLNYLELINSDNNEWNRKKDKRKKDDLAERRQHSFPPPTLARVVASFNV